MGPVVTPKLTPQAASPDTNGSYHPTDVLDITVLMGGPSSEREVSLLSGKAIVRGLLESGHRVTMADISPQDTSALDRKGIDLVFIALHGEFGESGEVQRLCERRGLAYTGSGPFASELAMDKHAAKEVFRRAGISTPDWQVLTLPSDAPCKIKLPVVCKPIDGGSSVDVTIARSADDRDQAVGQLLGRYGSAMVEQFIEGPEVTVSILGETVLPILKIVVPSGDFYDYHAKYDDDAHTQYVFDHGLDETTVHAVNKAALAAHKSIGCRDMSRVDIMIDSCSSPQVLEVNTIPGFTSHSLLPKAAEAVGIGFGELTDRLARMAMARMFQVGG